MRFLKYFSNISILCIIRSKNLSNLHQSLFQLVILVTKIEIILWEKSAITVILSCLYLTVSSCYLKYVRPSINEKDATMMVQTVVSLMSVKDTAMDVNNLLRRLTYDSFCIEETQEHMRTCKLVRTRLCTIYKTVDFEQLYLPEIQIILLSKFA